MASNLSDLVRIDIDINAPVVDSASFDNIMIFGAPPVIPAVSNIPAVGTYNTLSEITDLGYKATGDNRQPGSGADPIGTAARKWFSNSSSPVVVAVQQSVPAIAKDVVTKFITSANSMSDAIPIGTVPSDDITLPWLQIAYNRTACDSNDVVIEKDGVVVFGAETSVTENANGFIQVTLGATTGDTLGLDTANFPGNYKATFTLVKGDVTTVIVANATYNADDTWNAGKTSVSTTPLEPIINTLTRALDYDGWWLACEAGIDESEFEECAELIETQEKGFAYSFLSETDPVSDIFFRSYGVCGLGTNKENIANPPKDDAFKHIAYAAKALKIHAGGENWANMVVAAVEGSDFTGTFKTYLETNKSNWIQEVGGKIITRIGITRGGEWIDTIRFRDWLKNDMQIRLANLLITLAKIPYTDSGIALVETQMIASLLSGREYGGIAPDDFDDDGNLIPGFTTSVPKASSLTATQRNSRKLVGCQFSARLAGAINVVQVYGTLTY